MKSALIFKIAVIWIFINGVASWKEIKKSAIDDFFSKLRGQGYDVKVRPDGEEGPAHPVTVLSTMYIINLENVDENKEQYTVQMYFRQSWNDSRLRHNLEDDVINLDERGHIWTPDLFFLDEVSGHQHMLTKPNTFMKIKSNGEVLMSLRLSLTFSCKMHFQRFPHDKHECSFHIESYRYTTKDVVIDWDYRGFFPIGVSSDADRTQFRISKFVPTTHHTIFAKNNYTAIILKMTLERISGYYVRNLIVPYVFLLLICWFSLWSNPKHFAIRLTLLLVVLYFMFNISTNLSLREPVTPYYKSSDIWTASCMLLVFLSLLELVLVTVFFKNEKKIKQQYQIDSECMLPASEGKPFSDGKGDSLNSTAKFVSRFMAKERNWSERIDVIFRILFPCLFIIFYTVYNCV